MYIDRYILPPHRSITTVNYHHTVQVAEVSVKVSYDTSTSTCNYVPPPLTTTTKCKLPRCKWTICAVAEWKSPTGASCNWWQPPPVQVECLHHLEEGKHHKHKVQRSECKVQKLGHKVQRSGPASALVGTGCRNNMQLQPLPPPTMQIWPVQHNAAISATCVRAKLVGWMVCSETGHFQESLHLGVIYLSRLSPSDYFLHSPELWTYALSLGLYSLSSFPKSTAPSSFLNYHGFLTI